MSLILNLGCGTTKIDGAVNVDVEPSTKPDIVCNFTEQPLPYGNDEVDKIYLFHTIEHIVKPKQARLLYEFNRVLKVGGELYISYPEFIECAKRFIDNTGGKREFWERTIYGRQLYPADYHVALMYTPYFIEFLREAGFTNVKATSEPVPNEYNTIVYATKGVAPIHTMDSNYIKEWHLQHA